MDRFEVVRELPGGETLTLSGEADGEGTPMVLLHGLSATRRYVLQGSKHLLRRGWRLISYDARGHGRSSPAPPGSGYGYPELVGDLETVLRELRVEQPVLVGSSMGAATAMAWALDNPARVRALVQITPAYGGAPRVAESHDAAAACLEREDVDCFVRAMDPDSLPERWRDVARQAMRQRIERHGDLVALARAMREVPRSAAFEGLERLEGLEVPTLVVGSRDEADPLHPLATAREYAERLPHAELVVEDEGESPLAWQGARLSRAISGFLER